VALCVVFYSAIFPFETFAIKFFIEARGTSRELGGFLVSILTASTSFGTPFSDYLPTDSGACDFNDAWVHAADPRLFDAGVYEYQPYVPMAMMGSGLLAGSGPDVAISGVHCRPV